jgi:hypothetical protein
MASRRQAMSELRHTSLNKRPSVSRYRSPKPDRRRALELLASCPDGATNTLLLAAHGLTTEMLVDFIRDALATGRTEHLVIARHTTEVMRVRITEAGRRVMTELISNAPRQAVRELSLALASALGLIQSDFCMQHCSFRCMAAFVTGVVIAAASVIG